MRISKDSISFYGNIVSSDANEFISYDYDLLINYFGNNKILTLISSKVNAKFRVGFDNSNKDINDKINNIKHYDGLDDNYCNKYIKHKEFLLKNNEVINKLIDDLNELIKNKNSDILLHNYVEAK